MRIGDDKVMTGNVVLCWDGLRKPDKRDGGSFDWNIQFLIAQNAPEFAELTELATAELNAGEFHGTMPAGGGWPLTKVADPVKYGPEYANFVRIKAGSSQGVPPLVDVNGQQTDIAVCGQMLYPGCIVKAIVRAFTYTKINKGISFGLNGLQIIDSTAPPLPVASGMSPSEVASAFGGAQQATTLPPSAMQTPMPTMQPPLAPGTGPALPPGPPPGAPLIPGAPTMTMTAKATSTYEAYIDMGWTDAQLRENGLLV